MEDTKGLAGQWITHVKGNRIGLTGDLGTGKTVFVRGMVAALGGDSDEVRSPTFTLMNIYGTSPAFYHFDLFRLERVEELDGIGFFEFLEAAGTKAVEWPDKFDEAIKYMDFVIEILDNEKLPDSRILKLWKNT